MKMKEVNFDWIMGFIEGEGCFSVWANKTKGKTYEHFSLIIGQKDREILDKINHFFGSWGRIHFHKRGKGYYTLKFERIAELQELAKRMENKFRTERKKEQFGKWYGQLKKIQIVNHRWTQHEDEVLIKQSHLKAREIQKILTEHNQQFKRTIVAVRMRRWILKKNYFPKLLKKRG